LLQVETGWNIVCNLLELLQKSGKGWKVMFCAFIQHIVG